LTKVLANNLLISSIVYFDSILSAVDSKSKLQLGLELTVEKRKNEILMNKLREAKKQIKLLEQKGKKPS